VKRSTTMNSTLRSSRVRRYSCEPAPRVEPVAAADRHLDWEGCFNVRDLGGLPAAGGRTTRKRALVRSDSVDGLTAAGWSALWTHGVRTVIDLRNEGERGPDTAKRPDGLATLHLPLDGTEHREFWARWASGPEFATPLYYRPHLERFPERSAWVVAAVAAAGPGGVLVHCVGGRDRTGQIAMLLLAVADVSAEDIADDYALSAANLRKRYAALGEPDQGPEVEEFLARRRAGPRDAILTTLGSLGVESLLRRGGLSASGLAAVRARLLA
jgi:protein-tyrosine phosphatase